MTLLVPLRSPMLARVNPVALLASIIVVDVTLLVSIDVVSAAVALVLQLAVLVAARLPLAASLARVAPIIVAAPLAGVTTALYGRSSGAVHLHWAFVEVSDGSLALGAATALRVAAIGIPGVLAFAVVDPTDLAGALAQVARLPARFVLAALAALRLVGLLTDDWRMLTAARRARGVSEEGRVRRTAGQAFALLVLALRRASTLATAMEARAFGAPVARTWARPSVLGAPDAVAVALAMVIAAASVAVASLAGTWNPVLGG